MKIILRALKVRLPTMPLIHHNCFTEANYADSVFIFLSLVKELQIKNGLTQIEAFHVEWWQSGREGVNTEILRRSLDFQ